MAQTPSSSTAVRRSSAAALVCVLAAAPAMAQSPPVSFPLTGHPARVTDGAPVADVRAFAVARAGDRAVLAFTQAADPHARGALRIAVLHAVPGGLERVGTDATLAPTALAVAIAWDGQHGAVVYSVPRPHRGGTRGRRARPDPVAASLEPLGPSALTASDIVLQALDGNGAATGRPLVLFEENARTFRVAVLRDRDGWMVAWTGAVGTEDEVRGTVRSMRVDDAGHGRDVATDTGFAGEVGDALLLAPSAAGPVLAWTGQRCASRPDLPVVSPSHEDPSAQIEPRARSLMPQQPPHEVVGPPIECDVPRVWTSVIRRDGASHAPVAGPVVASDGVDLLATPQGTALIAPVAFAPSREASLAVFALDAQGHVPARPTRIVLAPAASAPAAATVTRPPTTEGPPPATAVTPSRVPPPDAPRTDAIARRPAQLHVAGDATNLSVLALSPSHARFVFASQTPGAAPTLTLLGPPPHAARIHDLALAADARASGTPWLFVQTGEAVGGPLMFVDGGSVRSHAAEPEVPWAGDERLRLHVLAARAARAAETTAEGVWGPLRERPDWASNTALPGIESNLRRLRGRWDAACEPLLERARWLARHGVDASVNDLAREACDMPPDPSLGVPPSP